MDRGSRIQDPRPRILVPGSRILDPGPRIQDPGSGILDPGSRTQDPGSWIRDPGPRIQDPGSRTQDPGSWTLDPASRIQDPGSRILEVIRVVMWTVTQYQRTCPPFSVDKRYHYEGRTYYSKRAAIMAGWHDACGMRCGMSCVACCLPGAVWSILGP